ncbi:MAG: ATP-binding protein, partial [Propylenella sp.]
MRRWGGLTIRTRILAFQLIVGVAVLSLFAAAFFALRNFDYYLARGGLAHRQLAAVANLARDADQYSGSIASLLMTGTPGPSEIAALQGRIGTGFEDLRRLTEEETDFLSGQGFEQTQKAEFQRLARLHELYDDLNRRYDALLAMQETGQGEAAIRVFFREVDRQLDEEFQRLIDEAIAGEIGEIEAADSEAEELVRLLGWSIGITSTLVILATLIAGYLHYRSIVAPVARLSAGAVAIGEGDLSFRVGPLGADELGLFARRFDEMAGRIEAQQKLLVAAQSDLEAQVAGRTRELETANDALEDRDRSRVRFLADISHQLRTPLTVLRGEAEVTLRGRSASVAAYRETLQRVVEQAREMARLIEDLLVLARSETESIRFERETLDLGEVATEAVREAEILGRPREIRIEAAIGEALNVVADRQRMKQVLMIALDNAVKYSERGGAVRLDAEAENGRAVVAIRNKSAHLAEEELPRVFDRFYRGRDTAATGSAGSGLGLAIARWMVEKMGGEIALEREGGDGIKVVIAFPQTGGAAAVVVPPPSHATGEGDHAKHGGG